MIKQANAAGNKLNRGALGTFTAARMASTSAAIRKARDNIIFSCG
jgi:hypothetical protein